MLARTTTEVHTLISEFVYVLIYIVICFYSGEVPVTSGATVYMLHEIFAGALPGASSADVSVRKCHATIRKIGLLESHWETLLYGPHEIKDCRERNKVVLTSLCHMCTPYPCTR